MNFTEWMNQKQTKLAVFDFDSTLAYTTEKPADWDKKKDWYVDPASLQGGNFKGFNPVVLAEFKKAKRDPATHAVILTGRRSEISPLVRNHLRSGGLYGKRTFPERHPGNAFYMGHPKERQKDSHSEFYRGDHDREPDYPRTPQGRMDPTTPSYKRYIVERLMTPDITEIDLWEDYEENMNEFKKMVPGLVAKYPQLKRADIHWVTPQEIKVIPLL
jgi:hypothetical protein